MRDRRGRFVKGNPGGPGRPPAAVEENYLVAMREEIPIESWRKIVRRARRDAEKGDARAREWIGKYVLPARANDVLDDDPLPPFERVRIYIPDNGRGPSAPAPATAKPKTGGREARRAPAS